MTTRVRPVISNAHKYWVDKHRHYELKHFCLQYPTWKQAYAEVGNPSIPMSMLEHIPASNTPGDPTAKRAILRAYYSERIRLIERIAAETDRYLCEYILRAVTEELSYTYLKTRLGIPCSRNTYYDRYRKFFWLLNEARQ